MRAWEFKKEAKLHKFSNTEKVTAWYVVKPSKPQVDCPVSAHPRGSSRNPCNCIITTALVLYMMCLLSHASFNLLPTPSHPNPLCCSPTSPWPLSLWTSFPISLPDAASRPFQILLSADKSRTDVGRAGTGNSLQHRHPVPAGRGSFLSGTRGRGGG